MLVECTVQHASEIRATTVLPVVECLECERRLARRDRVEKSFGIETGHHDGG